MEVIRKIIDIKKRKVIIELPKSFETAQAEIIIFPYGKKDSVIETNIKNLPKRKLGHIKTSLRREEIYEDER